MKKIGKKKTLDIYRKIFVKLYYIDERLINQFITAF